MIYATLNLSSVNYNIALPLCGGEAEEEEKTDEKHEGDGAADVGHGSHGRDGHRHLFFPSSWERHPDMKTPQDPASSRTVRPEKENFLIPSSS